MMYVCNKIHNSYVVTSESETGYLNVRLPVFFIHLFNDYHHLSLFTVVS